MTTLNTTSGSTGKAIVRHMIDDPVYAYVFLLKQCAPILNRIDYDYFSNERDHELTKVNDLVHELYIYLSEPYGADYENWGRLLSYDGRSSIFTWIRKVARSFFSHALCAGGKLSLQGKEFEMPQYLIDSGVARRVISSLPDSMARNMINKVYIDKADRDTVCSMLDIDAETYGWRLHKAEKQFANYLHNDYPEYDQEVWKGQPDQEWTSIEPDYEPADSDTPDFESRQLQEDVLMVLDTLPERDRSILRSLYFDDKSIWLISKETGIRQNYIPVLHTRALTAFTAAAYAAGLTGSAVRRPMRVRAAG